MALTNCGYAMQSEDSRMEVHRILLDKCQELLQELSEDPRTRGDALLRKARRVLRQHRSPYDGTDPNVEFDTYYTQPGGLGLPGVGVRTIKPIQPGDIITADYGPDYQIPKAALREGMNPGPYQADFPYLSTVLNGLATSTSPEDDPEMVEEDKFYLDDDGSLKAGPET
ncbi:hypothetical protein Pmar_PMAR024022 [Perkinsus marinus ATCC 50983]|uniref:SET domain-containing protein n=1 Tax=Perkinsus marinus (strain ATCC 50983 / TXsc) TaxID=423536 RepID=C5L6F7_PERM5|nr:hypothetical protein Pmar_PMAR024022 [Perkinsus marinus ATCC 50983]EER07618.1 hypothetical protein Pmar_PMAR024022 [Perkinsus marinus ATCC 50983]|eukprot:XP_002775802.1 hypothetical protein Pmar_PMAR024022 [Perkinsus marinus ATCC 50983]